MNNEELNTALYQKMAGEQSKFRDWLLSQTPEEILNHAYECAVREDLLLVMEELSLTDAQAQALLESPDTMSDLFKDFQNRETGYMDTIRDIIECRADDVIAQQREVLRNTPVYLRSAAAASDRGEVEVFRASLQANRLCKKAIEEAISAGFGDNRLNTEGAKDILVRFGVERTCLVLANTVQQKNMDGRISHKNKEWAATIPMPADEPRRSACREYYVVDRVNPGLTDLFINRVRREMEQMQEQRPSVRERLAAQPAKNTPKISAQAKGQER